MLRAVSFDNYVSDEEFPQLKVCKVMFQTPNCHRGRNVDDVLKPRLSTTIVNLRKETLTLFMITISV